MIVIQKVRLHTQGLPQAALGLLLLCMVVWSVFGLSSRAFEKFTPVSWWFEYDATSPIVLASKSVPKDGFMQFHSNSIYHREISMRWEDTMVCLHQTRMGTTTHKVATQIWEARMFPRVTPDNEWWTWGSKRFPPKAERCRLNSVAIGTTDYGYKKVASFVTPWFEITGEAK